MKRQKSKVKMVKLDVEKVKHCQSGAARGSRRSNIQRTTIQHDTDK